MKVPMGSTVNRIDLDEINLENPPLHCFAPTSGSDFQVRHGPNYAKSVQCIHHRSIRRVCNTDDDVFHRCPQ